MAKHGPNRLLAYLAIHETVLEKYRRDGFLEAQSLDLSPLPGNVLRMEGDLRCAGGLVVTVDKYLRIVEGADTSDPIVQTYSYAYNVSLAGRGNLFRYDNAHAHGDHQDRHHRHSFDPASGATLEVTWVGPTWPTLGEVLDEAREWYWAHHDELGR